MREEYDFSRGIRNPYARRLKKQIATDVAICVLDCFKDMTAETGIPYQTLIDLYMMDHADEGRKTRKEICQMAGWDTDVSFLFVYDRNPMVFRE